MTIDWTRIEPPFTCKVEGPEPFFKDLTKQAAKKALSDFRIKERDVDDSAECLSSIRDLLLTDNPFFDEQELVILNQADELKDLSVLSDYCQNPSSSKVLILLSKDQSRLKQAFKDLNTDTTKQADAVNKYDLPEWIVSYAKKEGYRLKKSYAKSMIGNVGEDLYTIANELEKVFIHHDGQGQITQEDITSVLFQHEAISQFEAIEAWGHRKTDKALRLLTNHYENSSRDPSLKILASFLHHTENLVYISSGKRNGLSSGAMQSALGKPPFIMDKLGKQAVQWDLSSLKRAYQALTQIDSQIKTGKPGRLLIERFIISDFSRTKD